MVPDPKTKGKPASRHTSSRVSQAEAVLTGKSAQEVALIIHSLVTAHRRRGELGLHEQGVEERPEQIFVDVIELGTCDEVKEAIKRACVLLIESPGLDRIVCNDGIASKWDQSLTTLSEAAIRSQAEKILSSATFAHAKSLRRMLWFIVQQTLQGQSNSLKEYAIGVEVFDRGDRFDQRSDAIVRVEANRLRKKLKAYYDTEGWRDPILISLPEGGYHPVIQERQNSNGAQADGKLAGPRPCLAVVPFEGTLANPRAVSELSSALVNQLRSIKGLRIVPSPANFQTRTRYGRRILRELGVQAVLTGRVWDESGKIWLTAQVTDAGSGHLLWSGIYEMQVPVGGSLCSFLEIADNVSSIDVLKTSDLRAFQRSEAGVGSLLANDECLAQFCALSLEAKAKDAIQPLFRLIRSLRTDPMRSEHEELLRSAVKALCGLLANNPEIKSDEIEGLLKTFLKEPTYQIAVATRGLSVSNS